MISYHGSMQIDNGCMNFETGSRIGKLKYEWKQQK